MGLLSSVRSGDYAYRLYDEPAVRRLEQILILRKLNVGIRDIRRVFESKGAEAVLEILGKKVSDIDEEMALLHELKEIVKEFIRQIERADFGNDSDVKMLYEKAREIETHIVGADYEGNASPVNRLMYVADRLEERAASRLQIPDNVLKRLLKNVYFILGDGADIADELGKRYGIFVYHTCDHRYGHHINSDPAYQPRLSGFVENMENFFSQDPEEAMQRELGIVREYTPMVIMDLIRLSANHEKIICENDIDVAGIIGIITNAVTIVNDRPMNEFIGRYKDDIRGRDIPDDEKKRLISKVNEVWKFGKPENTGDALEFGIKRIIRGEETAEKITDEVAGYFGFS